MTKENDIQIENEEFWWEALDDFVVDDEIVIVDINKSDLNNNNACGLIERSTVDMKDWDALEKILNKKEVELHKLDFEDEDLTFLVFLYCEGKYVTSIQGDY